MVLSPQGTQVLSSYSGSYALLIGKSQYTHGWSKLTTIPSELQQVEELLTAKGFHVERAMNLKADALGKRFEAFVEQYGFAENNRLLFFYSGHGYTRKDKWGNEKGYLVPTDAPNPHFDKTGFLQKALEMNQILTWARRIEAKHALFLFDSCFSGTVFKAKTLPEVPRQISEMTQLPVRQFITAGTADETVPAQSVFTPAFIDALRYGLGDLYKDGYVTGEELGLYLKNKVPVHAEQHPQYGKIKDYSLSRGDFVFVVGAAAGPVPPPVQPQAAVPVSPVAPMPVSPVPTTPIFKPVSDRDGDGVADHQDNCPNNRPDEMVSGIYKSGSRRGCPLDHDNDQVPDYRDKCPRNRPAELRQSVNSDGCPSDSDRDGVADYQDHCPRNRSTELAQGVNPQGCPLDSDQDGVPDYRDNCAYNTAKQRSQGIDTSGCPADSDRDGVANYQDHCPRNTSKETSKGVDSRGCPLDKDRDRVADYRDACLGTASGVKVQSNGCPVPAVVSKPSISRPSVSTQSSYRYTDNGDGTVTDNRSGLVWLKKANCFGRQNLKKAMQKAANLASGQCGLRDGSRRGMWRLPSKDEWKAMVDKKYTYPALSNAAGTGKWREGDAFVGVPSGWVWYWSSSSYAGYPDSAWSVLLSDGYVGSSAKTHAYYVWAVRGGH